MQPRASILLREWRVGGGLSANAAAKRLTVDRRTYVQWETGSGIPSLPLAARLEDVTGIPMRAWTEPTPGGSEILEEVGDIVRGSET